jgi:acyl dehydratase
MPTDRASAPIASPSPLPGLNAATLLRALFRRRRRTPGARTPRTVFRLDAIDPAWLRRYRHALGFRDEGIPLTFYYLLAQRAQVATMLDPAFPFRLPGTVHTENALRLEAPARPGLPMLLTTTVHIRPPADNGAVYAALETCGEQDGQAVFECRSTYLVIRGQRQGQRQDQSGSRPRVPDAPLAPLTGWHLARRAGRAYAAVSGDWNPIHLWTWSARLMGMKHPIIHGMHTLARACAELEDAAGRPVVLLEGRFKAPAPLGSDLVLGADLQAGQFIVSSAARAVATGSFRLAE